MKTNTPIPAHLQTSFLKETEADIFPVIVRENQTVYFPAFIRQETKTDEQTGTTRTVYRYFSVPVPYNGQQITDYETFSYENYAALRSYFYGTAEQQSDLGYHYQLQAHILAVKQAFPKAAGEIPEGVTRFNTVKAEFWATIDEAVAKVGKTREDLPEQPFNAEAMLVWAKTNGMTDEDIATYAQTFSAISLNLLHNNRNWDELFND